ncbi:MAG: GTP 3',8-cyclase MoaA [Phycisphaeraceae bacterium]|nr:GTP 3',8-cyclase MoaA [Phycisphaeraceae bacterium]
MSYALPLIQPQPAPAAAPAARTRTPTGRGGSVPTSLVDSYGRVIRDLRLSLTDRCNFRCVYCMDPDVRFMRRMDLLTDSQMTRLVRVCAALGVRRVRLTGGEPTLHPTLTELIADLRAIGLDDLSMTTNGAVATRDELAAYRRAGIDRLTVSIDSLREDRFARITRSVSGVARVIRTVEDAIEVGLTPVKVNAVVIRGFNDDEVVDFAQLSRRFGVDVRLIEYMPLDSGRRWSLDRVVTADEMLSAIAEHFPLIPTVRERRSSPASSYTFADGAPGQIGMIASVSKPFCGACSRLRVTADGKVMPCLFSRDEWDIRPLLRAGAADDAIAIALAEATLSKQAGGRITHTDYSAVSRPMSAIGG